MWKRSQSNCLALSILVGCTLTNSIILCILYLLSYLFIGFRLCSWKPVKQLKMRGACQSCGEGSHLKTDSCVTGWGADVAFCKDLFRIPWIISACRLVQGGIPSAVLLPPSPSGWVLEPLCAACEGYQGFAGWQCNLQLVFTLLYMPVWMANGNLCLA